MAEVSNIILNHRQISHKLTRLAWQIYEHNMDEPEIWIAGINRRGMYIAGRIAAELQSISSQNIQTFNIKPGEDLSSSEAMDLLMQDKLRNVVVIMVDDVLNTGKTIMNAMLPFSDAGIKSIQVLVLAARSHRLFPVRADYVGISMATTLHEHLSFDNQSESDLKLILN